MSGSRWFRLACAEHPALGEIEHVLREGVRAELMPWLRALEAPEAELHVALVVPDDTRPASLETVVPIILSELAGLRADIVVLIASGRHPRPPEAWLARLRAAVEGTTAHVECHDAAKTERDRLAISRRVSPRAEGGWADAVVTVGVVEPHQYAGFSGGSKGIAIGCGSESTIGWIHAIELLRDPGVQVGNLADNPFRQRLDEIARDCAPRRGISLVPHPGGQGFSGVVVGAEPDAFLRAVELATERLLVSVGRRFDFAIIDVPTSKSANLYQASRALTYVALHRFPCVREGGTLVLRASCRDRYGAGPGEQAFLRTLARGRRRLIDELEGRLPIPAGLGGGAQRAYVLTRACERFRCVLIGSPDMPEAQEVGLAQCGSLAEIELEGSGMLIPDPFVRLPFHEASSSTALVSADSPASS